MKVGVDARALLAGRGVARFTRGLLAALAGGHGDEEWVAFVPGRTPVAPVHPRVTLVRHRLGGRAPFGAAAGAPPPPPGPPPRRGGLPPAPPAAPRWTACSAGSTSPGCPRRPRSRPAPPTC